MTSKQPLCLYPFANVTQKPNSISAPCCTYVVSQEEKKEMRSYANAVEAFHSPTWDRLRAEMLQGELPKGCQRCALKEKVSGTSMRRGGDAKFQRDAGIQEIEHFLGNSCNFKCRTCFPSRSSKWISDAEALGLPVLAVKNQKRHSIAYDDIRLKNLKFMRLLGGEPFLGDAMEEALTGLKTAGLLPSMRFDVVTNCSLHPTREQIELLSQAEFVTIGLSIDGIGSAAEYIRKGTDWAHVQNIFRAWSELKRPNFSFYIQTTLSPYSLARVHETLDFLLGAPQFFDTFYFGIVDSPMELRPERLPREFRLPYRHHLLQNHPLFSGAQKAKWFGDEARSLILNLLQKEDVDPAPFFQYTEKLDVVRGENVLEVFPEFRVFWPKTVC